MPGIVEEIGREGAAIFLELPAGRLDWPLVQLHMRFAGSPSPLLEIAGQAGGGDIFPRRTALLATRNDMVKGQIVG